MTENHQHANDDHRGVALVGSRPGGQPRVLVAEDDDEMRQLLAAVVRDEGYDAVECRNGIELFAHLEAFVGRHATLDFAAIISDILMPGPTGLEILEALHDRTGFPPMILITAFGDKGTHARAQKAGAAAMLDKPFTMNKLLAKLHEIVPRPSPGQNEMNREHADQEEHR